MSLARRRPSPQCLRAVRAAHFKPSATFPGIDPDAQMPLPPTAINNSVSRPDRKHHQHHVNPLATSRPSASPPTRPRPLCTDKVHVSQNISSAGVDDVREAGEGVGGGCLVSLSVSSPWPGFMQRCPLAGCGGSFCSAGAVEPPGPLRLLGDTREKIKRPFEIFKNYSGCIVEPPVVHLIVSSAQCGSWRYFFKRICLYVCTYLYILGLLELKQ